MEQEEGTDAPHGGSMRTGEEAAASVRSTLGRIACGLVFGGSLLWHAFWGVAFFASVRGARLGDYLVLVWTVLGLLIGLSMLRAVVVGHRRILWKLLRIGALIMAALMSPAMVAGGVPVVGVAFMQLIGAVGVLAGCIGLLGDEPSSLSH